MVEAKVKLSRQLSWLPLVADAAAFAPGNFGQWR